MLLETIVQEKKDSIEKRAQGDLKGVEYLGNLIEKNLESYQNTFIREDEKIVPELIPRTVYERVVNTLDKMFKEHTRIIGITTYHFKKGNEPKKPEAILGWVTFAAGLVDEKDRKAYDEGNLKTMHTARITDLGREIINDYRAAQGYVSLEKQMEHNKKTRKIMFSKQ